MNAKRDRTVVPEIFFMHEQQSETRDKKVKMTVTSLFFLPGRQGSLCIDNKVTVTNKRTESQRRNSKNIFHFNP